MEKAILIIHVVTAIALVGLILMQHGKSADAGSAFGGGSSQSLLGSDGTTPLFTKITVGLVTLFFATSLSLAYLNKHGAPEGEILIPEVPQAIESIEEMAPESDIPEVTVNPIEPDGDVPVVDAPVVEGAGSTQE